MCTFVIESIVFGKWNADIFRIVLLIFIIFQSQTWSFIPKLEQKYVMKPALVVWGQGFSSNSSGGKKKQFDVRAIGEGSIGDIKVGLFSFPSWDTT